MENILGRGVTGAKTWRQERARHIPGSDQWLLWLNPYNQGKRWARAGNFIHTLIPQITSQKVSMVLCIIKLFLSICSFSCISRHFQPKNIFSLTPTALWGYTFLLISDFPKTIGYSLIPTFSPLSHLSSATMFLSALSFSGLCPRSSMTSQFQILWPLLHLYPSWFSVTFLTILLSKYSLSLSPWKHILLIFLWPRWPFFDCFFPTSFFAAAYFFFYFPLEQALSVGDSYSWFFPVQLYDYLYMFLQQQMDVIAGCSAGTSNSTRS